MARSRPLISFLSLALFGALITFPLTFMGPEVESQPAPPIPVNASSILCWDHDNKDINNQPEIISRFEIAISQTNQDLSQGGTPLAQIQVQYPCPECVVDNATLGTHCEYPIAELVRGRNAGYYRLWVRAVDAASNLGAWSLPLTVATDSAPPKPPTGLKCK